MRGKLLELFPHYITHIRFPLFKNITPGTRIDFPFPLTALVGGNGSGKTSVLSALYGAPKGYSTGDYWFSTEVDPIVEGKGRPNRFIYGYYNESVGRVVETRKARVRKIRDGKPDPNYWEPTKESPGDGMDVPVLEDFRAFSGRSADRWNPVTRPVVYINFRRELSAFDKYFYFGTDPGRKRLATKKDVIVRDAAYLKRLVATNGTSVTFSGKPVATENRLLSSTELQAISRILGREYEAARFLRHRLFRGSNGLSVLFKTRHAQYSEAFAGSGEVAVTSCVVQVLAAAEGTLLLLDEPEVSLHPAAQERLVEFLMESCKKRRMQVVLSTHAPAMIAGLPDDAIKVFVQDASGTFSVIPSSHPYSAFRRLGLREGGQVTIVTEDRLAAAVVKLALLDLDETDQERFQVEFVPGGADAILKYRVPAFMQGSHSVFVFLDGDKRKTSHLVDPDQIPISDNAKLREHIEDQFGVDPLLMADGGMDEAKDEQLATLRRKYLKFAFGHIRYLPSTCPEELVLVAAQGKPSAARTSAQSKKLLTAEAQKALGKKITAEEIDSYANALLGQHRQTSNELRVLAEDLQQVAATIRPR